MRARSALPEGHEPFCEIDLQKDRKTALAVNLAAAAVAAVMAAGMHFLVPVGELFDMEDGLGPYALRFGLLLVLMIAYLVLHELTHALAMKLLGVRRVKFGFTGLYAYAGCEEDYLDRGAFLVSALAPLAVWTPVLAAACLLAPRPWFWLFWILEIANVSGAAGDVFLSGKVLRFPADMLSRDTGVSVTFYSARSGRDPKNEE